MTSEIDIKAGLELDWAIATAIGLTGSDCVVHNGVLRITSRKWDELRGIEHLTCEGDVAVVAFVPSSDLNAAFAAAEAVGLFKQYGYCEASGQHVITETVPVASWSDAISHASTAALAICAAILKLKKETT